ncbi:MAG TPA: hypothetical protein VN641_03400 [Urbifossiella sp.]|nr:hypothetical protein [Urbifossiella sp.]
MIDPNEFDATLRRFIQAPNFLPFVVELDDGRRILIRQPALAFGGGMAGFIDSDDGALVDFSHKQVKGFSLQNQEIGA